MTGEPTVNIPFNKFIPQGNATSYLMDVLRQGRTQGDGPYSKLSEKLITEITGSLKLALTSSGTDALEMAAILADIQPGDEVIMPSFTFVSSANSIVLRGGVPVFVDICPKTLNIDPQQILKSITSKTRAIMPVHYAGVACDMDAIIKIAKQYQLIIIEDAAHGVGAYWHGQHLGTIGAFGALSFHETKNISAGEGGALLVNCESATERSEIIRDKGTNRKKFLRDEVDRYTWVDVGSSFLPSEMQAALLASQLEMLNSINQHRIHVWNEYHEGLKDLENRERIQRPHLPSYSSHNGHIYWMKLPNNDQRENLRKKLAQLGIQTTSHYECLHLAPIARKFAKVSAEGLCETEQTASSILRLPLHGSLTSSDAAFIIESLHKILM